MKPVTDILLRYTIAVIVAILTLSIPLFYFIFKPLTIWPTFAILDLFYETIAQGNNIIVNGIAIEIIDACIAGSAFLLLFLLNIITRELSFKKRAYIFIFDSILLLLLNIFRLVFLIILLINHALFFDFVHKTFWYVLSTLFVVLIWILGVKIFKIKTIPFFSDLKFLLRNRK